MYIFDLVASSGQHRAAMVTGLGQLLQNPGIEKVVQDGRGVSAALRYLLGITLVNVFDTQV